MMDNTNKYQGLLFSHSLPENTSINSKSTIGNYRKALLVV